MSSRETAELLYGDRTHAGPEKLFYGPTSGAKSSVTISKEVLREAWLEHDYVKFFCISANVLIAVAIELIFCGIALGVPTGRSIVIALGSIFPALAIWSVLRAVLAAVRSPR